MAWLSASIIRYCENNGVFPEQVDQLVLDPAGTSWISAWSAVDVWGREYRLNPSADGKTMLVTSLGRDGQTGGVGDDADLIYKLTISEIGERNHSWLVLVVAAHDSASAIKELRELCEALGTNWMKTIRGLNFEFRTNELPAHLDR